MNCFTIIIVAYNEEAYVKLSIQSIRMFADVDNLSVVLVDNGSTDGLRDWATAQTDITYVYMDEGRVPFGKAVNQVRKALEITGDILIMGGHFLLTPSCLSNMQGALHEAAEIGAVGAMSNGLPNYQRISTLRDYEEAVDKAGGVSTAMQSKRVMELYPGAVLLKEEVLNQLGEFDEELSEEYYVFKDYCLRMIINDWVLKVCGSSIFWDICNKEYVTLQNPAETKRLEHKWGMHYFNFIHNENLIGMIQETTDESFNVLEVGCDCGATLLEIKNRYPNAKIYGSELNKKAAEIACHFAEVWVNNIEEQNLECTQKFDYVIFGDVLEHLRDPLAAIRYCKLFLKSNGCIIASIPNLMHISVMEALLQGNFTYTETGLLDKTHIHLFTFNEVVRMFQQGGYKMERVNSVVLPLNAEQSILIDKLIALGNKTQRFMYETFQYVVLARLPGEEEAHIF